MVAAFTDHRSLSNVPFAQIGTASTNSDAQHPHPGVAVFIAWFALS